RVSTCVPQPPEPESIHQCLKYPSQRVSTSVHQHPRAREYPPVSPVPEPEYSPVSPNPNPESIH
ncbi:hypothetical protein ACJMK2_042649, partial [Sinanodonta woodiana]